MNLFWRIFDTVLLASGIAYVYLKYGTPFFGNRKTDIESSIAKAKEYEKKAKELYEEAKKELVKVKIEIEDIKKEAVKEAEIEKNNFIENARKNADKILDGYIKQAKLEIDGQKKQLFEDALNASFKAVNDILQKEVTAETYDKINDNFLKLQEEAFAKQSIK
jgi:F0F1-type ATP synthase membrane subunit b/b'